MSNREIAGTATRFQVGNDIYLARPTTVNTTFDEIGQQIPSIITCFQAKKNQTVNATDLKIWRTAHFDNDDAFQPTFLQHLVFAGVRESAIEITDDAFALLNLWRVRMTQYAPRVNCNSGPYWVGHGIWHTVWKVHKDPQLAFTLSVWPSTQEKNDFTTVDISGSGYRAHDVAVPSRSYSRDVVSISDQRLKRSLKGIRVAIKDNFHIEGTHTSLGNRAYYELQSIQQTTADVVVRLMAAGAHIVGKLHLSSFAFMEHPMQSIDYQAPFNPRGDGYLITGGSICGCAAAIAAYDWLDMAIDSDTTGSARIPAFQTGVFSFRPSTKSISKKGLVEAWPDMDTPAWFGRDLKLFPIILGTLCDTEPSLRTLASSHTEILFLTDFVAGNADQTKEVEKFLADIARATGHPYRAVSIEDDWLRTDPVPNTDLHTYLQNTVVHGWFYSAYHSFDDFRQSYREAHGCEPFVTEAVRWYWSLGSQVSQAEHEAMMNRFSVFKAWFLERYMSHETHDTIIALNLDSATAKYRDEYPGKVRPFVHGLRAAYLAPILGAPELAVPISQIEYQSRITNKQEQLPVVISLLGSPGKDMSLIEWTLDALSKSGRPSQVKTGGTAF